MTYRKKLIEVALPLEAINRESAREKSIRHGHPSTLHLWWARRPLAACRAVLFASIVDDPSSRPDEFPSAEAQQAERERLFRIIEELVKWESTNNDEVLGLARDELRNATGGSPPPVVDPFCGGGSIPLEAQRLGLEAHASDLNPVAVLITKALIEIPPKFAGQPPVNQASKGKMGHSGSWRGAQGLAEDVRHYGKWMRGEAERRIGHLYPKVKLPKEQGGGEARVIAWLWARTVKCPNPACGARMPLIRSFWLSTKPKRKAWVQPIVDRVTKRVSFEVRVGDGGPPLPPKTGRGAKFRCLVCEQSADDQHIKDEGMAHRMSTQLMAIVAESQHGRVFLPPSDEHATVAASASPEWGPEEELPYEPRAIWCTLYGLKRYRDLFLARQLVALTTFSELVAEARERALEEATAAGLSDNQIGIAGGGSGATAYADAIATYLAFGVDRSANYWSSLTPWGGDFIVQTFGRQALPMVWDFAEGNPFSESTGSWGGAIEWIAKCLEVAVPAAGLGIAKQLDAMRSVDGVKDPMIVTDPPYYDNIGYSDLADYFYLWLRHSIGSLYPDLFSTLLTPKEQELIASPYRFGGDREAADRFFERGLQEAFTRAWETHRTDYPVSFFYAFKQAETVDETGGFASAMVSTGWETMLSGLLRSGFGITGTWPIRSERDQGLKTGTNVLASSVVLVCRPRPQDAPLGTRGEFVKVLKLELPEAVRKLQQGSIAPVDLAQAAIGPGMAVFSRFAKVLEAEGSAMGVRTALALINQVLDEVLTEQESEYDAATRWAIAWFEQHGIGEGPYGLAETLSKAKNTSIQALVDNGFLRANAGRVHLLSREELDLEWDPASDNRLSVWDVTQHLVRKLQQEGEAGAADLLQKLGSLGEAARDLAYRLFTTCERKGWTQEALAYNSLVVAWPQISRLAAEPNEETLPTLGV